MPLRSLHAWVVASALGCALRSDPPNADLQGFRLALHGYLLLGFRPFKQQRPRNSSAKFALRFIYRVNVPFYCEDIGGAIAAAGTFYLAALAGRDVTDEAQSHGLVHRMPEARL